MILETPISTLHVGKIFRLYRAILGRDKGRVILLFRELYVLKRSIVARLYILEQTLRYIDYESSLDDPDVWFMPDIRPNGDKYYAYIIIYLEELLHIHHQTKKLMSQIKDAYSLKLVIG